MVSTAIQLFTVCELDEPLATIADSVARAGYEGIEFNEEWFPILDSVDGGEKYSTPALGRRSIETVGTQIPFERLDTRFENVVTTYEDLACQDFIIPYLDEECFSTRADLVETANRLTAMAERLAKKDARLHYHNHHFEFTTIGNRTAFDLLIEETDSVRIELDIGWAAAAGQDPAVLLDRYADLIDLVHVKDMIVETETPVELGEGDIDLESCIDAAISADVEWLIYEYDWPPNPRSSLNRGAEWLQRHSC